MIGPIKFWLAVIALAIALGSDVSAQTECNDVLGLCMAGCASDRTAVRCMQRCDRAKSRCNLAGSFAMQGACFLLLPNMHLDQSIRRVLHEHPTPIKRNAQ